jgi:NAD(P)-dependent dehydrogenase (short-subunit alcohol dehydrogenase family)
LLSSEVIEMPLMDLQKRVAIVTGAGRGMGRSHALMLASRGARVIVNDIRSAGSAEDPAGEVVREITGGGGTAIADNHSVVGGASELVRHAIDVYGQLDIVVNNAGILSGTAFADTPAQDWQAVFDVHFRGTVDVTRAAWPHLRRSGNSRIINTASSGMLGNAGLSSYGAAKAAIFGLTRSIAMEGKPFGIYANCIFPSAWTRMTMEINDPAVSATLRRYFQPEHVSALVVWLSHQDTKISNEAFQVSGGRAGRLTMAMMPTVRVADSTPEQWLRHQAQLLADGPLNALSSTAQMFANELADADPAIRDAMKSAGGGLDINPVTGQ